MRTRLVVPLVALALCVTACAPTPAPSATATQPPMPSGSATAAATIPTSPTPTASPTATDPAAALTLGQRVGQLFMVGTGTGNADPATLAAVTDRHVGNVFLHSGARTGITATADLVAQFTGRVTAASTADTPLWVATDQEGGDVQVLSGAGFDAIPSAVRQGEMTPATLRADAVGWGRQLRDAGVNMNLAPVADIVTSPQTARQNKPIGLLNRQYGYSEKAVAAGAGAFADGMRDAGVMPTFKHFPGLGRTHTNTDFAAAVDTVVGADSPDVDVYRKLLATGPALVMMSTAVYKRIDPAHPAAFSPTVVTGLLRGKLGFDGVVITDDVSAAAAVSAWSPAQRATMAIDAGCDIVLVSSGPALLAPMYDAVLDKAESDPAFAAKVDAAADRVLRAKQAAFGAG